MPILITIITVVFNGVNDMESTINSVMEQRKNRLDLNIDYVVIDGCSNDGTIDIIKNYDSHITQWISERDLGVYDAMNKGVYLAAESYLLFLGAGDRLINLPMESFFKDKNTAVFGNVLQGNTIFKSNLSKGLKLGNSLHHQALLVHKSVMSVNPFSLNYKVYADYDLNIRLLKQGVEFVGSDDMLSYQLLGGLTKDIYIPEMLEIIKSNFGWHWSSVMLLYFLVIQLKQIFYTGSNSFRWDRV